MAAVRWGMALAGGAAVEVKRKKEVESGFVWR